MKHFITIGLDAPKIIDWGDDVYTAFKKAVNEQDVTIQEGDVIVITSKVVSMEEKCRAELKKINPSQEAVDLVDTSDMDPRVVQLIINESDEILGSVPHAILTKSKHGLSANAGIDLSNCPEGYALLLPKDPDSYARTFRKKIADEFNVDVAVLITDSRTIPLKRGTTGVTLGVAGMTPIIDERGQSDLYGYKMTITTRAVADNLATVANVVMGETDERRPFALIRGIEYSKTDEKVSMESTLMPEDQCLYFAPFIKLLRGDGSWL